MLHPSEVGIAGRWESKLPARVFLQLVRAPIAEVKGRISHDEVGFQRGVLALNGLQSIIYHTTYFGENCFPRCDLSTFTGVEKCGKTIVTSVLMSLCLEKQVLELERISDEPMKVMWFDTEQSKSTTHHILSHRISNLITNEEARKALDSHIFVFNVRMCTYQERMASYSCLCS